ncbi:alpha/beta hydrolase [Aestuariivirga litoralis]|nr:alpha/beta hydrolase [Aestuariivirga litoralis]
MPLDPRAARFLEMMAVGRVKSQTRDIADRRLGLQKLMAFAKADHMSPPGTDLTLNDSIPARLYVPEGAENQITPGIIFFHGGGLVAGSIDTHDVIARALCASSSCRLISVGYRLAPEHPFPAALDDAIAAGGAICTKAGNINIDPKRIALVGESGGGALALLNAHELKEFTFALLFLICPVLDFASESDSRREFAEGYLIDRVVIEGDLADVLQGRAERTDPRVSPLHLTGLERLPPTIIHTAEYDPLRDEGNSLASKLSNAAVRVTLHQHAGMLHNFHALGGIIPQGREALQAMGEEIGKALRA